MDTNETNKRINLLLKKIRDNDLFAMGELMELKTPAITAIAFNILHDRQLAEDVVNEVMILLLQNIHKFKNYKNINGWINSAAINRSIDFLRKKNFETPSDDFAKFEKSFSNEDDIIEKLTVANALKQMPPDERAILVDRFVSELTLSALSGTYGLTMKQVRVKLKNAIKHFEELYKK